MEKSAFNVKLGDLCHYSMLDKSEIQFEKNRFPFCALLQVMDILSDKATGTSRWEERFMPQEQVEQAKSQEYDASETDAYDIMKEINAYQEVSFKTAPKSVILSNFLETGNYNVGESGANDEVSVEVLGKKSIREDESLDTETLAVVLEKQGKYDRAIGVYEKLIAKYPEKSSTFAIRISELKIKMDNK